MIDRRGTILIALSCIMAACEPETPRTGAREPQMPLGEPNVPLEKTDSFPLNGTYVPIKLKLARPYDAPQRFLTYVPEDMTFSESVSDDGTAYRFYSNPNAYLLVYVFTPNTRREDAERAVNVYALSRLIPYGPAEDWTARDEFSFERDGVQLFGSIDLRTRGDRYHYVAQEYRAADKPVLEPRANRILAEWRWLQ